MCSLILIHTLNKQKSCFYLNECKNQTKIVKSKNKRKIVKTDNIPITKKKIIITIIPNCNLLCPGKFYKFGNILPGMRRKVNISTLMVFRNQRRRREMFFNKFQYSWTEQLVSL
jgi:hypothetical protein